MTSGITSAAEMARSSGTDPKTFRAALRRANLLWHTHNTGWDVRLGSPEHADLVRVLATLVTRGTIKVPRSPALQTSGTDRRARAASDESWIIDLCDEVLGETALRHRFGFLLGDPGISGRRVSLPVDAFYPQRRLVIEYHERQHTERVGLFDNRPTVSGMPRGEQRRRYDEIRKVMLPGHGYNLVILDYSAFSHTRGRLHRVVQDREIVAALLREFI